MDSIKEQLVRHEGLRLKQYRYTMSKLTIVRMNGFPIRSGMTDDCGISHAEQMIVASHMLNR